jgi:hypothetical protein
MTGNELIDIVILPQSKPTEELAQKVATNLGQDLYQARTLLASKISRIILRQTDLPKIADLLHQMDSLASVSFPYKNDELKNQYAYSKLMHLSLPSFSGGGIGGR